MMISELEQESRKRRIIYTAYRLFCSRGIDGVSVAMIAKEAGVGHASVFRYFNTKAELILCTQNMLWEEIVACVCKGNAAELFPGMSGLAELEVLLLGFRRLYEEYSGYLLFATEYKLYLVRQQLCLSEAQYYELLRPVRLAFLPVLERGQQDGSITKKETVETLFSLIWCVMRSFVDEIILHNKIYTGENPWSGHFSLLVKYVLESVKTDE